MQYCDDVYGDDSCLPRPLTYPKSRRWSGSCLQGDLILVLLRAFVSLFCCRPTSVFSIPHARKSALKVQTHLRSSQCTPDHHPSRPHPNPSPLEAAAALWIYPVSVPLCFQMCAVYIPSFLPSHVMTSKNGIHKQT